MNDKPMMIRVAIAVVAVPLLIMLFSVLANVLCEVWCHEAIRFLDKGGVVPTANLKMYWFVRNVFVLLGALAGLCVSQAVYLVWQGKETRQ